MKSLCASEQQRDHLLKLVDLLQKKTLTGTQAWAAFADPSPMKTFKLKNGKEKEFAFSLAERKTYSALRQAVQLKLYEQYGRACAYCRRPVGHYGYAWHIEHVLPKANYPTLTFELANLTVGCVHCNRWKGVKVDKYVKNKKLPIIDPVSSGFEYSKHLRYLQLSTEHMSLAKYAGISTKGKETYKLLRFDELERVHAINDLDGLLAALHSRLTQAMSSARHNLEGQAFVQLLGELNSAIYRNPSAPARP